MKRQSPAKMKKILEEAAKEPLPRDDDVGEGGNGKPGSEQRGLADHRLPVRRRQSG